MSIKTPIDASTPPDDRTIILNSEGELEVPIDSQSLAVRDNKIAVASPSTKIIGTYENGWDGWNTVKNGGNIQRSSSYPKKGSYSLRLTCPNDNQIEMVAEKTVDLTGKNTLSGSILSDNGYYLDAAKIRIGGTTVKQVAEQSTSSSARADIEVDVSTYTGSQTVQLVLDNTRSNNPQINHFWDQIKLSKSEPTFLGSQVD